MRVMIRPRAQSASRVRRSAPRTSRMMTNRLLRAQTLKSSSGAIAPVTTPPFWGSFLHEPTSVDSATRCQVREHRFSGALHTVDVRAALVTGGTPGREDDGYL